MIFGIKLGIFMITSKKLRHFILMALIVAIPVHSESFFGYYKGLFHGQVSTKTKIGIGLVGSVIVCALIKYAMYKRDALRGIDIQELEVESLIKAVENNDKALILMLLKYGVPINKKDDSCGLTALEVAVAHDSTLVEFLLEKANCVNRKEIVDEVLFFAIKQGGLNESGNKSIELLFQDQTSAPRIRGALLAHAAYHANKEGLDFFIRYGKKRGQFKEKYLYDALFQLVRSFSSFKKRNGIEMLMDDYGVDINKKQRDIRANLNDPAYKHIDTPLTMAILVGAPRTVRFLLEKGAELEITDEVSAYDYVEDIDKFSNYHASKNQVYTILDNHRRTLAEKYLRGTQKKVYAHLSADTTGIVMQYVDPVYPLMQKRPLMSLKHVEDGTSKDMRYDHMNDSFKGLDRGDFDEKDGK